MSALGDWPLFDADESFDEAQPSLIAAGLSDGLPLVPPTSTRLAAMLHGSEKPEQSLGQMPPLFGDLTPTAVAYNCVLAGCTPDDMPIVLAATNACRDDAFNLLGLATTTGSPAIATVVHGPIAQKIGLNSGINCLGPGNRANATIGRAISLVLRNVAGMRSEAGDMATIGQPGKYGFCFAEAQTSPFTTVHVSQGLNAEDNAVTVLGVSGTIEVLPSQSDGNWDRPEAILDPVATVMRAAWIGGGGMHKDERGDQVLLLPPELATLLSTRKWKLDQVKKYIYEKSAELGKSPIAAGPGNIHVIVTGGPGTKMTVLPLWGGGTRAVTRKIA
ncbi:MAG: hypothetical protein AAGD43_22140 [Pseudomonadota bacterium]